jgi:carboxyl-terminal processing protease
VVNTTARQEASRLPGNVMYIRMDGFQPSTGAWFASVIEANRNAAGLILDLRSNPGGLKAQLLKCLDALYAKPMSAGRDVSRKGKQHSWKVHGRGVRAFSNPVVVLVDELSMSSSEILAAAMEETGRGRVIGRKTPGKVLLSYEIPLAGGGRLQLAIRDYRTERGRRLEGVGVVPDEAVPLRAADMRQGVDRDMERAQAILNHK